MSEAWTVMTSLGGCNAVDPTTGGGVEPLPELLLLEASPELNPLVVEEWLPLWRVLPTPPEMEEMWQTPGLVVAVVPAAAAAEEVGSEARSSSMLQDERGKRGFLRRFWGKKLRLSVLNEVLQAYYEVLYSYLC